MLTEGQLSELLEQFNKPDIIGPPYEVETLMKYSKVIEIQEAEMDCDGYTIPVDGYFIIRVNYKQPQYRKRFTYCHELAHTLLWELPKKVCDDSVTGANSYVAEERTCDRLAAELLLPKAVFGKYARARKPCVSSLMALSKEFQVSLEVVLKRIQDLRIWREWSLFIGCRMAAMATL